jgi:excisionase family DNA binding protein
MDRPILTRAEINHAFQGDWGAIYPATLSPAQLASLLGLSTKTLYAWIAAGHLDGCCRKRGKHILIWRDKALDRIFNGPAWNKK